MIIVKIALIAHDKKKEDIIEFSKKYKDVLAKYELVATGTTERRYQKQQVLKLRDIYLVHMEEINN